MSAGERLDGEMDALVSLQIVVAVEALRALITTEGPVGLGVGLCDSVSVDSHRCVPTRIVHWHAVRHAVDEGELAIGVCHVGEDRAKWRIGEGTLLVGRWLRVQGRNMTMAIGRRRS